ncbi:hypothetical protein [Streptomyces qinzhouensis]|uniref:Toxin-antitoxin system, toxin component n=1 Tax=Streptomyces qinzhouensis TaxID=2599401 RepID=A0A5B8JPS5_9ACTN|nr:hypothetical protein [Streptomyces qinzhouensis]QDY79850.1 hypothetical protein FQU76_28645 [Streptomyces qinzhouensis]
MGSKSTRSAMRELRDDLVRALERARPEGAQEVFDALCDRLGERRGRPVVLRLVEFPPGTASGLYLDLGDRDVICVQTNTHPLHQLVIFGHEVWHMVAGHGGRDPAQPAPGSHRDPDPGRPEGRAGRVITVPARLPVTTDVPAEAGVAHSAVQSLAARTDFRQREEAEAETFGLELGSHLRIWLDGRRAEPPRSGLAGRIQTSLGHHRLH